MTSKVHHINAVSTICIYSSAMSLCTYYARVVLVGHSIVVPNKSYLILSYLISSQSLPSLSFVINRLKNKDVFELILKHNLFAAISDKIVILMEFDMSTAVQMLLDNREKIPVCVYCSVYIVYYNNIVLAFGSKCY